MDIRTINTIAGVSCFVQAARLISSNDRLSQLDRILVAITLASAGFMFLRAAR